MGHWSQNLDNIQVIAVASWVAKEQGDCVLLVQLGYADRGFPSLIGSPWRAGSECMPQ